MYYENIVVENKWHFPRSDMHNVTTLVGNTIEVRINVLRFL